MADERRIWDQQDDEPNRWYQRFCAFRLLGPGRSILETYNSERATKSLEKLPYAPSAWRKAAEEWQWRARAAAYDQYLTNLAQTEVEDAWRNKIMGPNEALGRLSEHGRVSIGDFIVKKEVPVRLKDGTPIIDPDTNKPVMMETWDIDIDRVMSYGRLVKSITATRYGPKIEMWGENPSLVTIGKHHRVFDEQDDRSSTSRTITIPADLIAPPFLAPYRDIRDRRHTEYVFFGGRGSTKSSFISLAIIWQLVNNPTMHALALRQVGNTLRDSVYAQLVWAISELDNYFPGLETDFKCTTNPLEITYVPTGQRIFFRGADKPEKIKSIKPPFGYIALLWFEELDQFHGEEAIRKVEQSAIRGGDIAYIFKSFNPPRTAASWANKYVKIPKGTQLRHFSDFTQVPDEWLGKTFLEEAKHLEEVNPKAFEHEYKGVANGTGGLVFENVQIRTVTNEEIAQFDHVMHGQDWGYFPDPAHYSKVHYDAARMTLYIFGETRRWKSSNLDLYKAIIQEHHLTPEDLIKADSAEPKSCGDFRQYSLDGVEIENENGELVTVYGPSCKPAEKGPESVRYSMKWLQSLAAIVIDPTRCPYTADEFLNYELEPDPGEEGTFINEYPDKNNHAIDSVRYATNLIWRRRGQ